MRRTRARAFEAPQNTVHNAPFLPVSAISAGAIHKRNPSRLESCWEAGDGRKVSEMSENTASGSQTAIVTGGSRGLGRGVVEALIAHGVHVVALARDPEGLSVLARELANVDTVVADAEDELTAGRLLQEKNPDLVVLCAGASALLRPLHHHSWESFSQNWEVDAKSAFVWLRNALLLPMKPGSHIVTVSSMAAINGSPLSGSYAGAKRMLWFMADYAFQEINRLKLGIHIHCLLPTLNPNTDLGHAAIVAYAERAGVSIDEFAQRLTPLLTPAIMGDAVVELYSKPAQWDILGGAVRDGAGGTTRALCDRVLRKAYRHGNLRRDLHGRRFGVGALLPYSRGWQGYYIRGFWGSCWRDARLGQHPEACAILRPRKGARARLDRMPDQCRRSPRARGHESYREWPRGTLDGP